MCQASYDSIAKTTYRSQAAHLTVATRGNGVLTLGASELLLSSPSTAVDNNPTRA